jgi:hypothetical protein
MKQEEIMKIIERVTQYVVMNQVEATISIQPDMFSIELQPWRQPDMKCPYGKGEQHEAHL